MSLQVTLSCAATPLQVELQVPSEFQHALGLRILLVCYKAESLCVTCLSCRLLASSSSPNADCKFACIKVHT
jgi:hypothetical protein